MNFGWVPSHVGICGNEKADTLASDAKKRQQNVIPVDYRDFSPIYLQISSMQGMGNGEIRDRNYEK